MGRLYHFSWALGVLETVPAGPGQKKAGAEAPAKKRRNLDSDAPSNLKTVADVGEKSFNITTMPNFPQAVNEGLQTTSNR
jgi:hypothetical protein